jgi:cytochrome c oxidase subunit 4
MTTSHHAVEGETHTKHKHPPYVLVFIALGVLTAVITGVELLYEAGYIPWPRPVVNTAYLAMSITKAILVAMFYMHLKQDSLIYTVLFGMPVIFAIVFFTLLLI